MKINNKFLVILIVLVLILPVSQQSYAQVSFANTEIEIIVPFRKDGGTDRWARFWAPLLANELPGNPKINIKNVTGEGSTKGANEFQELSKGDDNKFYILASSASTMFPYLFGDDRVNYDYKTMEALIVSPTGAVVYAHPDIVYNDKGLNFIKDDAKLKFRILGPTQVGMLMLLSFNLLDDDYEVEFGGSGASELFGSFVEGESNVDMQTTSSFLVNVKPLIDEDKAVPLFSLGVVSKVGGIMRDRNFPVIPHFSEYLAANNNRVAKRSLRDTWKQLFLAGFPTQKMLLISDYVDDTYKKAYHDAIARVFANSDNWPISHEEILGDYDQYYGEDAQELLAETLVVSPRLIRNYKKWVKQETDIDI